MHNLLKKGQQPTVPMYPIDMPSYSPPSRSFFTPPHPPGYQYPFADKPTLRGTNSDTSMINAGSFANRRPIPPPSLMPGHERIPYRPPDLVGTKNAVSLQPTLNHSPNTGNAGGQQQPQQSMPLNPDQRKKALNTPAQKNHKIDLNHGTMDMGRPESALTGGALVNSTEPLSNNGGVLHFPSISRILSGSNGRKEDIPEVLLRTVTVRPSFIASASEQPSVATAEHGPLSSAQDQDSLNLNKNRHDDDGGLSVEDEDDVDDIVDDDDDGDDNDDDDDFSIFDNQNIGPDEPKTQPKIKQQNPKSTQSPFHQSDSVYSTQIIQNLANANEKTQRRTTTLATPNQQQNGGINTKQQQNQHLSTAATWTVAWNIHVYLSAILFTVLAVYSIFKMIFYDKLTHLFNQSYFICIHLTLIVICLARIFFLCYDAYNIHLSFPVFISELLLNLPATFLTISFAILILFLLIRSLNHKNNRYSALMRPLTVVVGSSVHVGLCITLHYVESNASQNQIYYQAKAYNGYRGNVHNSPPRVLSLICQIIYIFVCLSLGFFYLYVYRILKRVLRNKSQNYIHGYQNLSYAIHITIATALLFILMAALQVYGAISISTTRPLVSSATDVDWLQCGYQFSLRLIEIAIITLLSWVTGLKTGTSKVLQREKGLETHNVSGFALFPCTSSSSQEHFETDYPAICNANTNLHTYTLRTGKPIYDDNFALNSLGMDTSQQAAAAASRNMAAGAADFQTVPGDFRNYETNSIRSSQHDSERIITDGEFLNDSGAMPDHYENPNFELRPNTNVSLQQQQHHPPPPPHHDLVLDNCYSEPLAGGGGSVGGHHHPSAVDPFDNRILANGGPSQNVVGGGGGPFDFQNFEKPSFDRPANCGTEFRASKNLKAMKQNNNNNNNTTAAIVNHLDRGQYDNPERRSSNSNHSYASSTGRNFNNLNFSQQNSFERRGLRKSGTLNNIGGIHGRGHVTSSSSNSSSGRASGVQTLSSSRSQQDPGHHMQQQQQKSAGSGGGNGRMTAASKHQQKKERHRSSIERRSTSHLASGYMMSEDEYSGAGRQLDTASNASSDGAGSLSGGMGGMDNRDGIRGCHYKSHSGTSSGRHYDSAAAAAACIDAQHSSSGESATSGSMLVAEHGFVRFRALDDMGISKHSSHINSSHHGQQSVPGAGIQTNPTSSFRTTGRNKERAYTNS